MVALFVILFMTVGLALRAGVHSRMMSPAESANEYGLVDTCARSFVLVFLALLGLMALGMMYGNVLGAANAGT